MKIKTKQDRRWIIVLPVAVFTIFCTYVLIRISGLEKDNTKLQKNIAALFDKSVLYTTQSVPVSNTTTSNDKAANEIASQFNQLQQKVTLLEDYIANIAYSAGNVAWPRYQIYSKHSVSFAYPPLPGHVMRESADHVTFTYNNFENFRALNGLDKLTFSTITDSAKTDCKKIKYGNNQFCITQNQYDEPVVGTVVERTYRLETTDIDDKPVAYEFLFRSNPSGMGEKCDSDSNTSSCNKWKESFLTSIEKILNSTVIGPLPLP